MPADPPAYAFSLSVDTAEFSGDFGEFVSEAYAFPLDARWNLASLPLVAGDPRAAEIYPNAVSDVFAFDQGYLQRDTIFRGEGYWIKSPFAQSVWVPGSSILDDTIAVGAGWNIIGSINETVPVSSVTTDPPGIIASSFFSYHGGYTAVLNLSPGMGAWVNVKKAGRIILHGSGQAPARLGPDATGRLR